MSVGSPAGIGRIAALAVALATCSACVGSGTAGAASNAAAGAVLYPLTGGCKWAGCPPNHRCNQKTERCEPIPCGSKGCGVNEECDEGRDTCMPRGTAVQPSSPAPAGSATAGPATPLPP